LFLIIINIMKQMEKIIKMEQMIIFLGIVDTKVQQRIPKLMSFVGANVPTC